MIVSLLVCIPHVVMGDYLIVLEGMYALVWYGHGFIVCFIRIIFRGWTLIRDLMWCIGFVIILLSLSILLFFYYCTCAHTAHVCVHTYTHAYMCMCINKLSVFLYVKGVIGISQPLWWTWLSASQWSGQLWALDWSGVQFACG